MSGPVFVDPFLGAGAVWLRLVGEDLVPPVSWMGGKRRLATDLLRLLELRPGTAVPCLVADASWWGWVWPTVMDPEEGPTVSATLRSWRGEDPRQLWFRLRDEGPMRDRPAAAAQLLWLQARAASGVPVWWEGTERLHFDAWAEYFGWGATEPATPDLLASSGDGRDRQPAADRGSNGLRKWDPTRRGRTGPANQAHAPEQAHPRLLQEASTQVDDAGQRQARDPRLMAGSEGSEGSEGSRTANAKGRIGGPGRLLASDGRGDPRPTGQRTTRDDRLLSYGGGEGEVYAAGPKGLGGAGGIVDPGTIAGRLDAVRTRLLKGSGGPAAPGKQDGWCAARGWRALAVDDVADRIDRVRGRGLGLASFVHRDAQELTRIAAPQLHRRALVYLDPPYLGATGYPVTCPREAVLEVADTWARHGARVVLSEAVDLAPDLGAGWTSLQLRFGPKPEWVTVYGCNAAAALLPPLARLWGAA